MHVLEPAGDNGRVNESTAGPQPQPQPPVPGLRGQPPQPVRRMLAPLGVLAGAVAGFAYVGAVDPGTPGHYPACPLLETTGVLCPGCGGLRTAHAVAHGDFTAALGLNALAVLGFIGFAAFMAFWLYRAARGRPALLRLQPVHWWLLGGVTAVFMIVRNLPFGSALAP